MKLLNHLVSVAECWLTLAAIATLAFCAAMGRHRARRNAALQVRRIRPPYPVGVPVPPPLTPPFSQTSPSVDWFRDMPSDCLSDEAIRILADDIAANFRVIGGAA